MADNEKGRVDERFSMRRFRLLREEDETGMSGTGFVAEGVEMSTGKVVLQFNSKIATITIYDSIKNVKELHGHGESCTTRVVWMDPDPTAPDVEPEDKGG